MRSQKKLACVAALVAATAGGIAHAEEGSNHRGIPHLDHVFVIVMENQLYSHILGNANAPFTNSLATSANLANNYMGVGHPSLTNYLEIVGGSNFGIENDNSPAWHSTCQSALELQVPQLGNSSSANCPIAGSGTDAATLPSDPYQGTPLPVVNNPLPAAPTAAMTIADQLVKAGLSYKSYQESLPPSGADGVNISDGLLSDVTGYPAGTPHLYAVKHNPFVYFANVQTGTDPDNSLANSVGFERLTADLKSGRVPNYSFIVPNQCHDQHGRSGSEVGPYCQSSGTLDLTASSGDAHLIEAGDLAVQSIVGAIKASPAWTEGNNAIVVVWDENDYSPAANQVVAIVDTNYGVHGYPSNVAYNHFSLLKSIEAGFGLPYLNHAADTNVPLMSDLFAR